MFGRHKNMSINTVKLYLVIIIMYVYHALINTLSAHMIHINLNMIFCTHTEHSLCLCLCQPEQGWQKITF